MKNKLYLKISLMIIVFISTFSFCLVTSNAMDSIITSADEFLGKGTNETLNFGQIKTVSDNLYNLFFIVGVAATVIVGMIIGIKFMVESAEEKAKLKEALVPYIVGCVIIYGAFGIWKVAINIGKNLTTEDTTTLDAWDEEDTTKIRDIVENVDKELSEMNETELNNELDTALQNSNIDRALAVSAEMVERRDYTRETNDVTQMTDKDLMLSYYQYNKKIAYGSMPTGFEKQFYNNVVEEMKTRGFISK